MKIWGPHGVVVQESRDLDVTSSTHRDIAEIVPLQARRMLERALGLLTSTQDGGRN